MANRHLSIGFAAVLCGCQSNFEYARIGYGPELPVANAQCEIMSTGVEQGMWAIGSAEYVLGAQIGNAIGNEIRRQQFMKNCMIIKGWGQVPKAKTYKPAARKVSMPAAHRNSFGGMVEEWGAAKRRCTSGVKGACDETVAVANRLRAAGYCYNPVPGYKGIRSWQDCNGD